MLSAVGITASFNDHSSFKVGCFRCWRHNDSIEHFSQKGKPHNGYPTSRYAEHFRHRATNVLHQHNITRICNYKSVSDNHNEKDFEKNLGDDKDEEYNYFVVHYLSILATCIGLASSFLGFVFKFCTLFAQHPPQTLRRLSVISPMQSNLERVINRRPSLYTISGHKMNPRLKHSCWEYEYNACVSPMDSNRNHSHIHSNTVGFAENEIYANLKNSRIPRFKSTETLGTICSDCDCAFKRITPSTSVDAMGVITSEL
uniref:Uncharacterized protein LOC102809448 n=1 Tax=Saccoglossus kowalevskii TaxID=10224 RepID=A0ABM0MF83_SACKO|nr:PREDICTED: uncharacterized protein LOC102809448 [Saccoglossus kowalevskii]